MRKTPVLCIMLLCLLIVSSVSAQENWEQYTKENGKLPMNEIRAIAEDASGNLWYATEGGGVVKNDGKTWTVFNKDDGLAHNVVRSLAIDNDGVLWCGTLKGVSSYDGTKWTTYTDKDGLSSNAVISIAVDAKNKKWFGTYGAGVSVYDGVSWETISTEQGLPNNVVTAIIFDNSGNPWVATYEGVSWLDNGRWVTYDEETSGISSEVVYAIYIDASDTKWFGTYNGVCSFDDFSWTVYTAKNKYGILEDRSVYSIIEDKNNVLWFGSSTELWSFNREIWNCYTRKNSGMKQNHYLHALHLDKNDTMWIGTRDALSAVGVKTEGFRKSSVQPTQMKITGNFPNPFNPTTTIEYMLPEDAIVKIEIYNISGQKINTLFHKHMSAGTYTVRWNGRDATGSTVSSGTYFFRLEAGDTVLTHKMLMMK